MRPVTPDEKLAKVVGEKPIPRTELTKKLWAYIRKNGLQDAKKKTLINADENLKAVFNGKKQVSMFEMTKLVSGHVKQYERPYSPAFFARNPRSGRADPPREPLRRLRLHRLRPEEHHDIADSDNQMAGAFLCQLRSEFLLLLFESSNFTLTSSWCFSASSRAERNCGLRPSLPIFSLALSRWAWALQARICALVSGTIALKYADLPRTP